jgi:hypothetical protein
MGGWAAAANRARTARRLLSGRRWSSRSVGVRYVYAEDFARQHGASLRGRLAFFGPPTVTCGVVLACWWRPIVSPAREPLVTIAVPYAASSAYAWIYTLLVARRT